MDPKVLEQDDGVIGLGDPNHQPQANPGIKIKGTAKVPIGGAGRIAFIQLVNSTDSWSGALVDDGGFNTGWVLDDKFGVYYATTSTTSNAYGTVPLVDSPGWEPNWLLTGWTRSDEFTTYLMYEPTGPSLDGSDTIPVTIGIITWSWSVSASRGVPGANWTIDSWDADVGNGAASNELPLWSGKYTDYEYYS